MQNKKTKEILVMVSPGEYVGLPPSEVFNWRGQVRPEWHGKVVGPDIDVYWWHDTGGRILGETKYDRSLQGTFNEAMGNRITHGQWMEYPGAKGPNGPALVIHQGKFVWLKQHEIHAWFSWRGVSWPFPR